MFDSHLHPEDWGILPFIEIGNYKISSYSLFILIGILVAFAFYKYDTRNLSEDKKSNSYLIALSAITCGAIGAKLPAALELFMKYPGHDFSFYFLTSGRTIVGGLIGGYIGVKVMKKMLNIKDKRGNELAPAIAMGMVFGRIACFLTGCCYGTLTHTFFGVNFGDGFLRHPTQLYESLFHFIMVFVLLKLRKNGPKPGYLLKVYFICYFIFRFLIEFIRVNPVMWHGLSGYQIASFCFAMILMLQIRGGKYVEFEK